MATLKPCDHDYAWPSPGDTVLTPSGREALVISTRLIAHHREVTVALPDGELADFRQSQLRPSD